MPLLSIKTNFKHRTPNPSDEEVMKKASALVADALSKPEKYVMVVLETSVPMFMGGNGTPAAMLTLHSIGKLGEEENKAYSKKLCDLMKAMYGVPADRVYINFQDVERSAWGWNGSTFV